MNKDDIITEHHNPITGEIIPQEDHKKSGEDSLRDAKKYLGLMEAFEIDAGNMEQNMQIEKAKIMEEITPEQYSEPQVVQSIIETDELMSDFTIIRINLRKNIQSTSTLLEKFGLDLAASHVDEVSADMVAAYSELIKGSNTSMKLLIDSYSTVAKTQTEIKKLISTNKDLDDKNGDEDGETNVTNIVNFVGSPAELLASLSAK